jgi:hypothetical protein
MTGDLFLNVGSDRLRSMGCKDLRGENKEFTIFLGSIRNKLQCSLNNPITLQSTDGFLCKIGVENIMRIGRAPNDRQIDVYQNILMNSNNINDLSDPLSAQDAATKNYVDKSLKKCRVGYIPPLEADVSVTGFVASASECLSGSKAYHAFTNLKDDIKKAWDSGQVMAWLQIKCPEPVKIWRIAIKTVSVAYFDFDASNDGVVFEKLPIFPSSTNSPAVPRFCNITRPMGAYQYYRVTSTQVDDFSPRGIQVMQLYVYDD